jgi:two-component system response regulator YesN
MMRVLIVDDEVLSIVGIRHIIDWEKNGYEIVGEAHNGKAALPMIRDLKPHIVLTDMMMPVMDGFGLIREAKKENLPCKFIILSCVSEIESLQQAIKMGVSRYIIKNVSSADVILNTVNEVAEEIRKQSYFEEDVGFSSLNTNIYFNEFLNLVFKKKVTSEKKIREMLHSYLGDDPYWLLLSKIRPNAVTQRNSMVYSIADLIQNLIGDNGGGYTFVNYEDYICSFVKGNLQQSANLCRRLSKYIQQCFDLELIFESGSEFLSPNTLAEEYEKVRNRLEINFYRNDNSQNEVSFLGNLSVGKSEVLNLKKEDPMERFLSVIETVSVLLGTTSSSEKEAKKLYTSMIRYMIMTLDQEEETVMKGLNETRNLNDVVFESTSFAQIHQFACDVVAFCFSSVGNYTRNSDKVIDQILSYIEQNYQQKITLTDLSEQVHFTTDYICRYFKRKTGVHLMDYVLNYKVQKAKEMLAQGMTVSAISEQLCFSSDAHFSKTFKKYVGLSPGVYAKKIQN